MGQEPAERGGADWPVWALALIALVIIAFVLAMLAWFTSGPGKGLSKPTSFSQSSHAVTRATATRVMVVAIGARQERLS